MNKYYKENLNYKTIKKEKLDIDSDFIIDSYNMDYSLYKVSLINNVDITDLLGKEPVGNFESIKDGDKVFLDGSRQIPEDGFRLLAPHPIDEDKSITFNISPLEINLEVNDRKRVYYPLGYVIWQIANLYNSISNEAIKNLYIENITVLKTGFLIVKIVN